MRKSKRIVRFSDKTIEGLSLPITGRVEWWDESTANLSCRITECGAKSFYWVGRSGSDWKRTMLGPWPSMTVAAARNEAKRLTGQALLGKELVSRAKNGRRELKLVELFEWYMENHSRPHKRTWKWDENNFETSLSHWGNKRVSTVRKSEVQELHVEIGVNRGPYAGNKMLELLGHMYRLGAELNPTGVPCTDPTKGIKRFPREERERFLDSDELPRFLAAVSLLQREVSRDFLLLALYTGGRRANVMSMRWDELSIKTAVWKIPKEKSKNKREMKIALSPPALEILKRRQKTATGPWVLPGHGPTGHYNNPKDAMRKTCIRAGLKDVRVHDLRRTLGSWMAVDSTLQVIGKQLGHSSLRSVQIYARLATKALQNAVGTATEAMAAAVRDAEKE